MSVAGERVQLASENALLRKRIDELERAAADRADSTRLFASLLPALPAFIVCVDPALRVRYVNHYHPGLVPDSVVGRSVLDFHEPECRQSARAVLEHTLRTGQPGRYESLGTGANGQRTAYETHVAALSDGHGCDGLCLLVLEITRLKERELALSESQQKLAVALEATGLGLWSLDVESGEIIWDDAMRRLHGCDTPRDLRRYTEESVHPLDRDEFDARAERVLSSGQWDAAPYRIVRPGGDVRWLLASGTVVTDADGKPIRLVGGNLDVTAPHAIEEQLRQAQKMEALGNLTAGIAHNFNNMLTVIMPTLELTAPLVGPERRELLHEAAHAARRAAELVRQLMTFAGHSRSNERAAHALDLLVEAAVEICRRAFDSRVTLSTSYDGPKVAVGCRAGEIEQVLVNLLLNARDAVLAAGPDRGHVRVHVTAHGCDLPALAHESARRPAATVEISDDGVGMSEEVRTRVFEPFFTTKPVGRGTGLGLTTSYAIIRDHQGALSCRSEPGQGTTFTLTLPLTDLPPAATAPQVREPLAQGLCVLVVDDEGAVRAAVGEVLADAGLRVLGASGGAEALALLAQPSGVDVVLLDRSMPGGSGETFVPRMREIAPRTRILFFTGQMLEPELAALVDGVVHKPVQSSELLAAIRRAVASAGVR